MPRPRLPVDFRLYLITDRHQARGNLLDRVEQALSGGIKAVQLREKDLVSRELFELATEMRKLTAQYGALLFINDRIDIALAVDADGIHLGGDSIPLYKARHLVGKNKMIGVSCHNQISAMNAQDKGADFITYGPVFYTPSKAQYGEPLGLSKLKQVTESLTIPVFGLGGVTLDNAHQVMAAGTHGISLISAVLAADRPQQAAESLIARLNGAV
ncbi:thiamine phosphate synthase [Geobacter sp. DSM 9736]|uniref:thiamine phosphate synthase n=1 Tax=Geobacter sp. DSM 9736 TaxID=1277350 RepID=UPI000B502B0C|nr:thiamine phosphate synthase [Geobacter sp. DSM 9736]SNB48070.1 thiamine-phosphate diphosphorylase [Geobacter sp. DSM 9736]